MMRLLPRPSITCAHFALAKKVAIDKLISAGVSANYFDPAGDMCYCSQCFTERGDNKVYSRGGRPYLVPLGWCRIGLVVSPGFVDQHQLFESWVNSYHGTSLENAVHVFNASLKLLSAGDVALGGAVLSMRDGHIEKPFRRRNKFTGGWEDFNPNQIFTSPSIVYSSLPVYAPEFPISVPGSTGRKATLPKAQIAFQLRQRPKSFSIGQETVRKKGSGDATAIDPLISDNELEYYTREHVGIVIHGLLVKVPTPAVGATTEAGALSLRSPSVGDRLPVPAIFAKIIRSTTFTEAARRSVGTTVLHKDGLSSTTVLIAPSATPAGKATASSTASSTASAIASAIASATASATASVTASATASGTTLVKAPVKAPSTTVVKAPAIASETPTRISVSSSAPLAASSHLSAVVTIQIFVRTFEGKTITLDVEPSELVDSVIQRLVHRLGYPFDLQVLSFGGHILDSNRDLKSYDIQRSSTIHLSLRCSSRTSGGVALPLTLKSDEIRIHVKTLSDPYICLMVKRNDAVGSVKKRLRHQLDILDSENIELMFKGMILNGNNDLEFYNIECDSELVLHRSSAATTIPGPAVPTAPTVVGVVPAVRAPSSAMSGSAPAYERPSLIGHSTGRSATWH